MALTPEQIAALLRPEGAGPAPAAPLPTTNQLNPFAGTAPADVPTKLQAPADSIASYLGQPQAAPAAPKYIGEATATGVELPKYAGEVSGGTVAPPVDPEQASMWGAEAVQTGKPTMVSPPGPAQQSTRTSVSYQGPSNPGKYAALEKQGDQLFREKGAAELDKMGALAEMQSVAAAKDEADQLQFQQDYENARQGLAALSAKRDQMMDALNQAEVDPQRYFKSQSAMQQAMLGASLAMGYVVQAGFRLDHNPVMKTLESALERDLRAQEAQLTARSNALSAAGRATEQSQESMRLMGIMNSTKRQHYWDMMGRKLTAEAEKRQIPIESKNMQILLNEIEKRRLQAQMQADAQSRQLLLNRAEARRKERIDLEKDIAGKMIAAGMTPPNTPAEMAAGILGRAGGDSRAVPEGVAPWAPKEKTGEAAGVPVRIMVGGQDFTAKVPAGLAKDVSERAAGASELSSKIENLIDAQKAGKLDTFNPNYEGLLTSIGFAYGKAKGAGAYDAGSAKAFGEIFGRKWYESPEAWASRIRSEAKSLNDSVLNMVSTASNNPATSSDTADRQNFRAAAAKAGQ